MYLYVINKTVYLNFVTYTVFFHEAQTFVDDISHEIETMKQFMDSKDFNIQYTMLNATSRIAIFNVNLLTYFSQK